MKRRFEFRLARLARVRSVLEETARSEWSQAEGTAREAETEWSTSADARARAQRDLASNLAGGSVDPRAVLQAQEAIDQLGALERTKREQAQTKRWQASRFQEAWQEREQDRQAIEKLEERDRQRHRATLEQVAQAELDEVASSRHARRALQDAGAGEAEPIEASPAQASEDIPVSNSRSRSGPTDLPDRDSVPDTR